MTEKQRNYLADIKQHVEHHHRFIIRYHVFNRIDAPEHFAEFTRKKLIMVDFFSY